MLDAKCFYHPYRIDSTTCERCHRPICKEPVFKSITREYCVLCYASQKKSYVFLSEIGLVIVLLVCVFFALSITISFSINPRISAGNLTFFGVFTILILCLFIARISILSIELTKLLMKLSHLKIALINQKNKIP